MTAKSLLRTNPDGFDSARSHAADEDENSPNSSAMMAVTLIGDLDDILAAIRTGILLAKNLRATLYLAFPGEQHLDVVDVSRSAYSELGESILNFVRQRLHDLVAAHTQALKLEVTITVASFISAGTISMRIRRANVAEVSAHAGE